MLFRSDQPEPRPRPCPLPGFGDKCICILQQSRFRWLTRIAAESSVRGNQDIIPMTCDVLRIFRADTLMRSTTMEKHDNVFIVRITGPIISRESRSEEHTSELQSLMRISYAVFCLKKKTNNNTITTYHCTQPI